MAKAEYRSSIRSKNLIKKAVAKLIHEKELSKITVSDIIREADISRGTFYAHYSDVDSVLKQIENEELEVLIEYVDRFGLENIMTNVGELLTQICEYLSRDMEYYRMLAHSNMLNNFLWRLVEVYYDRLLDMVMSQKKAPNRDEANIYLIYVTSGAKQTILSWLNGNLNGSPKEISEIVGNLVGLNMEYYS
ncbi:MAG: TetR/AcrR family transcriptional regulator C-terminal domain-containing protein [Clostridia bacterium]|nr:TetR/AcrR family transcriptional regulator C-terminal domain-containing protein [Clostridia bacterium]